MTDAELLTRFFSAWGQVDARARLDIIDECTPDDVVYADPHCPAPVHGSKALNEMLAEFTKNVPGGTARPIGTPNQHNGYLRATISFERDGEEMMRGQYFAQRDGDKLRQVIGFVGMGDEE